MPDSPILDHNRDPAPMPGYHADMSELGSELIKVARSLVIPADPPAIEPAAGGVCRQLSEIKPDAIHFSTSMAKAQPGCPYNRVEDMAKLVEEKTGIKVILGPHDFH